MLRAFDFFKLSGKKVKLTDCDGKEWIGKLSFTDDYESEKDYFEIKLENVNLVYQFDEEDVVSIEVIE